MTPSDDAARAAVRRIYAQVRAPHWAAPNLDGLGDVLRDLSWLAPGPVPITVPPGVPASVERVLARAVVQTAGTERPVELRRASDPA